MKCDNIFVSPFFNEFMRVDFQTPKTFSHTYLSKNNACNSVNASTSVEVSVGKSSAKSQQTRHGQPMLF